MIPDYHGEGSLLTLQPLDEKTEKYIVTSQTAESSDLQCSMVSSLKESDTSCRSVSPLLNCFRSPISIILYKAKRSFKYLI